MKFNKKNIVLMVVSILLIIGVIPKISRYITTSQNAKNVKYVAIVEKPQILENKEGLELSGELKPFLETDIFSRVSGLLKARYVQLGDKVKKGDLLAEIDTPDLDAETSSARSNLISARKIEMEAKYQYEFASSTYDRFKKSAIDGAISTQELENKYNNFKTSEMSYQKAIADVNKAQEDLNRLIALENYKKIVAPFDGIVSKYNVDAGANIVAGGSNTSSCLFKIEQVDKFRVSIFVPQNYVRFIKKEQNVDVYIPENPSEKFQGKITEISKRLDNLSRTMEVIIEIKNKENSGLYSGLYVKTNINIDTPQKVLTIKPESLVTLNTPDQYVAVIKDDSTVHYIKVKQGRDLGDKVEILEGLSGNEKIITNVTENLQEGQKVDSRE